MAEKKRILVVDDDVDIVRIVTKMLSDSYAVETAVSGEEAIDKVRRTNPDLVLLDIMMPCMNGIEVLRRIKEMDSGARIVMITAFGDIDTYLDAMEWGALEYINKPFETEELLRMIKKLLTQP
jgi:DNA-binding response OmpR family regulator